MRIYAMLQIAFLLFILGCMQNRPIENSEPNVEALEATITHQFQAMLEGDVKMLERIFSDEHVMTSRRGAQLPKADWLQMLASGELKYLNVGERTEVAINLYGNVA